MSKRNFTDGEPRIATESDCKAPWSGGKNGKYFRCGFCGHRFEVGDYYRWQHTNDIPGASGNPLVCKNCDDVPEKVRKKWKEKCEEFNSDKWWWFRRA